MIIKKVKTQILVGFFSLWSLSSTAQVEIIEPFGVGEWGMTPSEFQKSICTDESVFPDIENREEVCQYEYAKPLVEYLTDESNDPISRTGIINSAQMLIRNTDYLSLDGATAFTQYIEVKLYPIKLFGAEFVLTAEFIPIDGVIAKRHLQELRGDIAASDLCWEPKNFNFSDEFDSTYRDGMYCEYPPALVAVSLRAQNETGQENFEKINETLIENYYNDSMDSRHKLPNSFGGAFQKASKSGTAVRLKAGPLVIYRGSTYLHDQHVEYTEALIQKKSQPTEGDLGSSL